MAATTPDPNDMEVALHSFTYGSDASIPVYVANYMFDVINMGAKFLVIFMIAVAILEIFTSHFKPTQVAKQTLTRVIVVGVIALLLLNLKVTDPTTGKKSYFAVKVGAEIMHAGEVLADSLLYNILYVPGSHSVKSKPKDSDKIRNIFTDMPIFNILASESAYHSGYAAAEALEKDLENRMGVISTAFEGWDHNPYIGMSEILPMVQSRDSGFGFSFMDNSPDGTIEMKYAARGLGGFDRTYMLKYSPDSRPQAWKAVKLSGLSVSGSYGSGDLYTPPGYLSNMLHYIASAVGQIGNKVNAVASPSYISEKSKNEMKRFADMHKKISKLMDDLAEAAATANPATMASVGTNVSAAASAMLKSYSDVPKTKVYVQMVKNAASSVSEIAETSSSIGDGWTPESLESLAQLYKKATLSAFLDLGASIASEDALSAIRSYTKLTYRVPASYYAAISGIGMKSISPYESKALASARLNEEDDEIHASSVGLTGDVMDKTSIYSDEYGKDDLATIMGDDGGDRKITWVNLGYYYSGLKAFYTKAIVLNMQVNMLGIYEEAVRKNTSELMKKILVAKEKADNAANNTDFDKIVTVAKTAGGIYAAKTAVSDVSNLFSTITNLFKSGGKASFKALAGKLKSLNILGIVKGIGKTAGVYFLTLFIVLLILSLIYVTLPAFLWTIAVLAWFLKTSVLIAVIPFGLALMFFRTRIGTVQNLLLQFVGQALVPAVMVAIFFIVITFSIAIEQVLDMMIPVVGIDYYGYSTGIDLIDEGLGGNAMDLIISAFKAVVMLLINTQLYMQFFRADDYISDVLGVRVSYGSTLHAESILSKMRVGV